MSALSDMSVQECSKCLNDGLDIVRDIKIVAIVVVQCSHELGMAQTPDFIPKLIDHVPLLHAPAIALHVLQCDNILHTKHRVSSLSCTLTLYHFTILSASCTGPCQRAKPLPAADLHATEIQQDQLSISPRACGLADFTTGVLLLTAAVWCPCTRT